MSDPRTKVTGGLPMLGDLADVGAGLLHARLLTAPVAHARLAVDTTAARAVPGVHAVFSGRELEAALGGRPLRFGPVLRDQPPLAVERVRYAGEPVAVALAADPDDADEALRHVGVDYDPLPLVTDPVAALDLPPSGAVLHPREAALSAAFPEIRLRREAGTNLINHFVIRKGDAPGALARADHVFSDTFTTPAMHHGALENHVAIAVPDAERLVVWSTTQTPYKVRVQLAELLDVPLDRVAVRTLFLGGAFGAKCYAKIEPLAACLARALDRPVRLCLERSQTLTTVTRHATRATVETGVRSDGSITARLVTAWFDAGAYADISPRVIKNGAYGYGGPYDIDDIWVDVYAVYTNRPPAGAFRGYASPQAAFAYEGQTELIARRLGLDPAQVRRVNLLRDGSRNVTGETVTDCHYDTLLDVAENALPPVPTEPASPVQPAPPVRSAARFSPMLEPDDGGDDGGGVPSGAEARGRGVALTVKGTNTPSVSQAAVLLNRDGSVQVLTSTVEMGQGAHTALARLAAEALGIEPRVVSISLPDTDVTPYDQQTSSSRSTFAMGGAVRDACAALVALLARLAADHCDVPVERVQVGGGQVRAGAATFGYGELVTAVRAGQLRCEGSFASQGGLDHETGQGIASSRWHQASGTAEVAVDLETGRVRVLRYHAVVWAGRVVNPVEARLQVEGAVILGLGSALGEQLGLDPSGRQAQLDLLDYRLPALTDLPEITVDLLGGPDDEIYGLGETAVPPVAPAVAAAVADATGVVITDLPLSPERVLAALRAHRGSPRGTAPAAAPALAGTGALRSDHEGISR